MATHWRIEFAAVLVVLLQLAKANVLDLNVTMFPRNQNVMLQMDSPLVLSFLICGTEQDFEGLSYRIRISRASGSAQEMFPVINGSLVLDSSTENGIAASVWSVESPAHEKCVEVPIRVDAEHPDVTDSSIELRFTRGTDSLPLETYIYRLLQPPVAVESEVATTPSIATTASTTTTAATATTTTTTGGGGDDTAESNSPVAGGTTSEDAGNSQTTAAATTSQVLKPSTVDTSILSTSPQSPGSNSVGENVIYIIAGLGAALVVALLVIFVLVVCALRRRRNNLRMLTQIDLESSTKSSDISSSSAGESKAAGEDAIMLALHWNKTSSACEL